MPHSLRLFDPANVLVDRHDRAWILTTPLFDVVTMSVQPGEYDVVSPEGLVKRVWVPLGWRIAGFMPDDRLILRRDDTGVTNLALAAVRASSGR